METIQAEIDLLHKKELEIARNYAQQRQDADEMQNDIASYMSKKDQITERQNEYSKSIMEIRRAIQKKRDELANQKKAITT